MTTKCSIISAVAMHAADPLSTHVVLSKSSSKYIALVLLSSLTLAATFAGLPALVSVVFPGCTRPDCFDIVSEMSASIDTSVDPCDNFYDFVCSGWHKNYPQDAHNLALLRRRIQRSLYEALTYYKPSRSTDAIDIAGIAFQSCTRVALHDHHDFGVEVLREFLDYVGVPWPSIHRYWNAPVLDLLVKLCLDWNIPIFFDLSMVPDFRTNKGSIVYLSGSTVLEEWIVERHDLGGLHGVGAYIERLARALGDPRVDYRDFAEKVSLVDIDILATAIQNKGLFPTGSPRYVKYGQLSNFTGPLVPAYRWVRAINRHLPEDHPVMPDDSLFISDPRLFSLVEALLSKYVVDDRASILVTYVGFHVARLLSPYASLRLASLSVSERSVFLRRSRLYHEFLSRCYSSVTEHLGHAIAWIFINRWVPEETREKVAKLVDTVRDVSLRSFRDIVWMDDRTRKGATEKVSTLREIIGRPEHLVNRDAVDHFYRYLPPPREPYLAMLLALKRAKMKHLKEAFAEERAMRREDLAVSLVAANAYYVSVYHVVVVPAGLMFPPFYVRGGRDSLNYGGLGHVVGHEITHVFDPQRGLLDRTGLVVDWYSNYSRSRFRENLDCLRDLYNHAYGSNDSELGGNALSENFADCVGLSKSYAAFREVLSRPVDPATMALSSGKFAIFTEEQLFFLNSCYKWCGWDVFTAPNYAPLNLRCNVPLMNMAEFSEAFRCPRGSRMNPSRRCANLF